jgi:hypothetical protein
VRVIDEDAELALDRRRLEPARDMRGIGERDDGVADLDADRASGGDGGERVVDVEAPDERQADQEDLAARIELVGGAGKIGLRSRRGRRTS